MQDECGIGYNTAHIVGGTKAKKGDYPFMALLGYKDNNADCPDKVIAIKFTLNLEYPSLLIPIWLEQENSFFLEYFFWCLKPSFIKCDYIKNLQSQIDTTVVYEIESTKPILCSK